MSGAESAAGAEGTRTVVLGFDALDFRYLDRFAEDLPNFRALRERGVAAPLASTFPPWTPSAWPSMYTGTDPSHHGVYGFFTYDDDPEDARIVTRNDVDAPALWNYLTARDAPSVVVNLPVTHPAEPIEGVLVPGYLAAEDAPGYPRGIREELSEGIDDDYRIYATAETSEDKAAKLESYLDLMDVRQRAFAYALETYDWRLAVLQVQKTDAVFHNFHDDAAHRRVYRKADELLGAVLESVDDATNVVVCSDHGIGPMNGYQIYLNEILADAGYVERTRDGSSLSMTTAKSRLVGEDDVSSGPSPAVRAAVAVAGAAGKVGLTPGLVYRLAERAGVESTLLDALPYAFREELREYVDWEASRAYLWSDSRLGVRINLAGRDAHGVVPPEEYESVRADLVGLLEGVRTPDGEPAFESVRPREAVYDGPHADDADDILLTPARFDHSLSTKLFGTHFVALDGFDHKPHGVFVGAGPGFTDASVDELSLTDVAPVVMALLGYPVPTGMTGRVPDGLLTVPVTRAAYDDVTYGTGRNDAADAREDAATTERLEDLGYL